MRPGPRQDLRRPRGAGTALALLLALALLVGCGEENGDTAAGQPGAATSAETAAGEARGGSDAPELSSESIGKRAFVKRANRICKATIGRVLGKAGPALKASREDADADAKALEAELIETVMAPELRSEVEEIGALGAPRGGREQIERFLAAVIEIADEMQSSPESFTGYNQNFFARSTRLADAYGLDSCPYG